MASMTITEALAELKTLDKRVAKKREFIGAHLMRQDKMKDPLEKDGGQRTVIAAERQSIGDLERRTVAIRVSIAEANARTPASVNGETRFISEWLIWRRDVAPVRQRHLAEMQAAIHKIRNDARTKGIALVSNQADVKGSDDVIVNVDERGLAAEIEALETTLGTLDGVLSLKNATVVIDV